MRDARPAVLAGALAVAAVACATAPPPGSNLIAGTHVRVLGSYTGEERRAFEAVVGPFEARTRIVVDYTSSRDLAGALDRALADGSPPDLAGLAGPAQLRTLAARGVLRDLTQVIDMNRYRSRVAPTFIELGTVNGRFAGAFLRSTVKGLIWYNPAVFALGTPSTWDELQRMALAAAGRATAEWCVGLASREASGWPGTDLVEQFLLRTAGVPAYDAWTSGELAWTSNEIRNAFRLFGQVVAEDAVYGGAGHAIDTDFSTAGAPLFADPPGCLLLHQGSFMPAFFQADGRRAGIDYDFLPFPRVTRDDNAVIGGGDLFGVLSDNPAAARLLEYLVSDEAQAAWVAQGGTLSVSASVTDYPDDVTRRAAALLADAAVFRFDASDLMSPALASAFEAAVLTVTDDPSSLEVVLRDLERHRTGPLAR